MPRVSDLISRYDTKGAARRQRRRSRVRFENGDRAGLGVFVPTLAEDDDVLTKENLLLKQLLRDAENHARGQQSKNEVLMEDLVRLELEVERKTNSCLRVEAELADARAQIQDMRASLDHTSCAEATGEPSQCSICYKDLDESGRRMTCCDAPLCVSCACDPLEGKTYVCPWCVRERVVEDEDDVDAFIAQMTVSLTPDREPSHRQIEYFERETFLVESPADDDDDAANDPRDDDARAATAEEQLEARPRRPSSAALLTAPFEFEFAVSWPPLGND